MSLASSQPCESEIAGTPDFVIINARIHRLDPASLPGAPPPTALAVKGNRILCLGNSDDIRRLAGKYSRVIDAQGALVLPGFNDAHLHFLEGGFSLSSVDLRDADSPGEFARRIGAYAARLQPGKWITGGEWDHERWPGAALPGKEMIDRLTPDNPVFVHRTDQHMALANSLALQLAGVGGRSEDVPGGLIVRNPATGEPTGVLKDAAMQAVWRVMPTPNEQEKRTAVKLATDYAARLGVTSVHDMSAGDDLVLYQSMAEEGQLKTRIYGMHPIARWEELARTGIRSGSGSGLVRIGGVKGFSDGSLGSSTAYFFEPFADDPNNRGLLANQMFPQGIILERVLGANRAGLQVLIHAIGDQANLEVLDIFQRVARQNGPRDRRFRIEHAQHLRASEIARFASQQVIASVQPYHAINDGRWCESRLGPERARGSYAFGSLLKAGATVALGTDWTVAPLDPMLTIYAAVTRRTLDGKHSEGWLAEQKITVEEAVRCYTAGSARAEFREDDKGTLAAGKLADLVIIDKDIFQVNTAQIPRARVVLTIMDGRIVYEPG